MERLGEFFAIAWTYKVSLVPVLVTYFIFDLPAISRKLTRVAYVPIYFAVFPIGHSDKLYAEYFNEDDFYGIGESMSVAEKHALRQRIQATAIFSMIFASVIAPWLCGFISAFYLTASQFREFLIFFFIVKSFLIGKSLWNLRGESRAAENPPALLSVVGIYAVFIVCVWYGLTKSFNWTSNRLVHDGFSGVAQALADYAYVDLLINIGVVAALTWALTITFTDPKNIAKFDRGYDAAGTSPPTPS